MVSGQGVSVSVLVVLWRYEAGESAARVVYVCSSIIATSRNTRHYQNLQQSHYLILNAIDYVHKYRSKYSTTPA